MRYLTSIVLSLPLIGAYAIFAIGIVLIYRASRVLNIAHGAMAMFPGYLFYEITRAGVPVVAGFPIGVMAGGLLGWGVERVFIRRLRGESETAQTVGTVAALAIMIAVAAQIWGTASLEAVKIFPAGRISVGLSNIRYGELGLFAVMLVVTGALFLLIQRTDLGLKMRGSAESRLAASLMGVNPQQMTTLAWVIGGSLAALAGILLAAVTSLHPYVLPLQALPAFIAALIGGMGSLLGALVGAFIVGATLGLVPVLGEFGRAQGAPQLLLTILAMVVMASRGTRLVAGDVRHTLDAADAPARRRAVTKLADSATSDEPKSGKPPSKAPVVNGRTVLALLGLGFMVSLPFFAPFSALGAANLGATYALVAVSLVLLTGWVGQISLGHAALVGVGAYLTGWVTARIGIPFPLSLSVGAVAGGLLAALLGIVALRVRGLYLAVATLLFSWMASEFLFRQQWFVGGDQIPNYVVGGSQWFPSFDLSDRKTLYFISWALVGTMIFAASNLRRSKTGRAFFAVRGSEMAAASLGIDVTRTKLMAFATSGAIAGIAGNLVMVTQRVVTADQFTFNASLYFLAIAVVGGLSSLGGAVASSLVFAGLTEVFFRFPSLGAFLQLVSALLLAVVLLAYRGGLASLPGRLRPLVAIPSNLIARALLKRKEPRASQLGDAESLVATKRPGPLVRLRALFSARYRATIKRLEKIMSLPPVPKGVPAEVARSSYRPGSGAPLDFRQALLAQVEPSTPSPNGRETQAQAAHQQELALARRRLTDLRPLGERDSRRPLIHAQGVTVRFGGLVAVNNASLSVREGEIVGLIGPNGAGKTTLFNAIAGYNDPASGTIRIYGSDATRFPVHARAKLGVARTFQILQLFSDLSVYDNLLVATHVHNPSSYLDHLVVTKRSIRSELAARARVEEILELLDLEGIADKRAADLPFGILRMVEVARSLVTGFRLIMLDEPASGLDNRETDRLMEVLRFVRGLGVTLLVIEHDVRMVTGVSDYMYVLDQGKMISEGTPEHIQADPAVIAAYLGEPAGEKELVS